MHGEPFENHANDVRDMLQAVVDIRDRVKAKWRVAIGVVTVRANPRRRARQATGALDGCQHRRNDRGWTSGQIGLNRQDGGRVWLDVQYPL